MQVKLLKDARIRHKAGDIVEVSPDEMRHLIAIGQAAPVAKKKEAAKKTASK